MGQVDFRYEISDERLIAYGRIPVLDRLKWLDDVRRFTLMVRAAPSVSPTQSEPSPRTSRGAEPDAAGGR